MLDFPAGMQFIISKWQLSSIYKEHKESNKKNGQETWTGISQMKKHK